MLPCTYPFVMNSIRRVSRAGYWAWGFSPENILPRIIGLCFHLTITACAKDLIFFPCLRISRRSVIFLQRMAERWRREHSPGFGLAVSARYPFPASGLWRKWKKISALLILVRLRSVKWNKLRYFLGGATK